MRYCGNCGTFLFDRTQEAVAVQPRPIQKRRRRGWHTAVLLSTAVLLVAVLVYVSLSAGLWRHSDYAVKQTDLALPLLEQLNRLPVTEVFHGLAASDAEEVQRDIDNRLKRLTSALEKQDTERSLAYFTPSVRSQYENLFHMYPDIMPEMASLISQGELSALSDPEQINDSKLRTAEYRVVIDDFSFFFVLVQIDGVWYLLEI